jgi:phospholipid/cholesterol/gamma-HCH transport system substrate-binding protein
MASKNLELKVGLLVLVGAAILFFAVWLAKGYRYGQEFYSVSVRFPEVGALSPGDPVTVSGVNKGKVRDIKLDQGGVLVTLALTSDVVLKQDATFAVKNIGLMGERFVAVHMGKSETPLDMTHPAAGTFDPGIPEVMGMMGQVIESMNHLVNLLGETVISPATLDKFSQTITSLQQISARLEKTSAENAPKIDSTIKNFAQLSEALKKGLDRNISYIDTAAQNFDAASKRLVQLVADMEEASAKFKSFATDLDESEGSLRLLMEDRRLYDDVRRTAQNIDSLVNDIRQDPRKYINFTLELF